MENIQKYNQAFITTFNIGEDMLNQDFVASRVDNWDSITHLSLMTEIEDTFDIMLDTDDILSFLSYEMGKEILAKYDVTI
jgi:acyl carrier protein